MNKRELDILGYSEIWVSNNVLDKKDFAKQLEIYNSNESFDLEFFRYETLKKWAFNKVELSTNDIKIVSEIIEQELYQDIILAFIDWLIRQKKINLSQFIFLSKYNNNHEWIEKKINVLTLKDGIDRQVITKEMIQKAKKLKLNYLIEEMIDSTNDYKLLEFILNIEPTKKIKSKVKNKLEKLNKKGK